ncbi:YbjN domain-containing protein [Paracrocinitomix mangrovi]|uniref:YbjN domain-containing protein n=1 Tax=Paracrocinitomix mangrovi TaxID=2862509 RepID=UPI001C8EB9E3|nr:YbjN domain-containing protein [Paracrocinitomix mangrovi]UKN01916.1 YbjN domain-containing protein [Paracrocinitomix mangrovi]
MSYFDKVKDYLMELEYSIVHEDRDAEFFVVESLEDGISNLMIGIADPIIIVEQFLFELNNNTGDVTKQLLMKNRDIVHGAFAMDDDGKKVMFRDTLQVDTLDLEELEGTLTSLSLLLSEYTDEIIGFSKN